ncbi:MAG TPA: DMT family transporter [Bacteroidota bacterium]|nr:DMT family transporter [Bacteroidota bacterium]
MRTRRKAEAALLATTLIWGSTFTAVKLGMQEISPVLLIVIRFSLSAAFFLVFFRRQLFPIHTSAVIKGSILGFFLFLGFVFQNVGMVYTTASKSAFITSMMVVFVPLLQFIVERRSPNLGNILGVVIVTAGLWFLTQPTGSAFNIGDALTLGCALVFAIYIVYLDVVSQEMSTSQLTFLQMASNTVFSFIAVVLFENVMFTFSAFSLLTLAYLTVFATIVSVWVQTRFQKDTTPTRAVIIFTIEPVIASVIAHLVLGEQLGTLGILGGGLIIGGVLISQLSDIIPGLGRTFD